MSYDLFVMASFDPDGMPLLIGCHAENSIIGTFRVNFHVIRSILSIDRGKISLFWLSLRAYLIILKSSYMWVLAFFGAHWYLSLFTQSFFNHRYAAHRQFTMSKGVEKFFYVLSFVFQGSSYLSPRAYAIMHRMHHAYADTALDPHSPKYDANLFAMMWRTRNTYMRLFQRVTPVDAKFTKELPDWKAFDDFACNGWVRLTWIFIYIGVYILLGAPWWLYPLIFVHAAMGPFHGVIINWFAHTVGYVNFKMKDTSRNLFPVDLIMIGEGLHNNHHKHSGRANFAWKKYEFDPVYPIIKVLDMVKMIRLRRVPLEKILQEDALLSEVNS